MSEADEMAELLEDILDDSQLQIDGYAYAWYFWVGVVTVVFVAFSFNAARKLTLVRRLRDAANGKVTPAMPANPLMKLLATVTAMGREMTYLQLTPTAKWRVFKVPTLGTAILVLTHLCFVLALEFIDNNVEGEQHWQALGVRAGWLAVAQMPLLILLIGKNNIIGLLTGTSYERLNVFHRWTSRIMLLMAILHFGYQSYGWQKQGVMTLEWQTDDCPITGIAAFAILLWMNLSTIAPFRTWPSYEFFVVQHIITFIGFIVAVIYHLPSTALSSRVYVYVPIGLYLLDRIVRTLWYAYLNLRVSRATLTALEGGVTRIQLNNKSMQSSGWRPGSHVLISMPKFGYWQTHPATIASTPQSHNGDLIFLLKSHRGFTRTIMNYANNSATALLPHTKAEERESQNAQVVSHYALIDGPYGGTQSDMAAFDSVCLIAGSTGLTFVIAILQDLAQRASFKKPVFRHVHLVWCVKNSSWANWANDEINAAVEKLQAASIEVKVEVYVTCADSFTEQSNDPKECPCACDKSLGPCCCVIVDEEQEGEAIRENDEDAITPSISAAGRSNSSATDEKKAAQASSKLVATTAVRLPILPCAEFHSGRPEIEAILRRTVENAQGESGIAVCGPIGLGREVRNCVVKLSDQRAVHKGTGAQGIYLHVESFS
ncbi:hypothetical protein K431DRAFT_227802 [Polychaeton citri CBS 116435]|uniref:FAD-binding FR-type domain-containing protein n=1 Tax=Polychaeton citri CBS 116435 TaxID=1314669 RepID=A0A9P4UNI7_9PEZI|nr:hypothetical protein K431DRAFT_227802 [Polychaeton citri CBS 116435]